MRIIRLFALPLFCLLLHFFAFGQADTLRFSLSNIVALAQSEAPNTLLAETRLTNRYWFFQSILADYRPQISFTGELPDLNRSIDIITLPNGNSTFIPRSQVRNSVGLSIQQQIRQTGGTVFVSSSLQRLDIFQTDQSNIVSYFTTPVSIGFSQPLFGFNVLKWNKKIEPLRYQEATKEYAQQMEDVAYEAADLFFDVFIAQLNLEAARKDKANADTLFEISKGRFEVGRIAETELLQIELSAMNGDANVAQALLDLQSSTESLRNYLGITTASYFKLSPPTEIPQFSVDAERALSAALQNRSEVVSFERRLLEAQQEIARAKANSGFTFDITGQFGLSQTGDKLSNAYQNPLDNERVRVGLTVPLADWGKAKSRLEVAKSNQDLERMNVEQERVNFERDILLKVLQFDLVRNQVSLARRAYEVSIKRQEITRDRYYVGKIGITDLNIAVTEQEAARRSYMNALRAFWLAYYDLRRITLYDFERGVSLVRRPEGF